MEKLYYYKHGTEVVGPLSANDLRASAASGKLAPNDLVWLQGETKKVPATAVRGLFPEVATGTSPSKDPAPLPSAIPLPEPPPPPGQTSATQASKNTESPKPNAPNERMEKAAELARRGAAISKTAMLRARAETKVTAATTWGQTKRAAHYVTELWRGRALRKSVTNTQVALGQRMYAVGVGDENLRTQLTQLDERVRSVQAAKGSTRPLETERKGLYLRLAEKPLEQSPPPGIEAEHRHALDARANLQLQRSELDKSRANLFPVPTADRVRVLAGYAVCVLALLITLRLTFHSTGKEDLDHTHDNTTIVDNEMRPRPTEPTRPNPSQPHPRKRSDPHDDVPTASEIRLADAEFQKGKTLNDEALPLSEAGEKEHFEAKAKEAITHFANAVRLNPRHAEAYLEMGKAYLQMEKNDEAIANFTRVIEIDPQMALGWSFRAVTYSDGEKLDEAISDATKAIDLDPNIPLSYLARGAAYMNKSMYNEAITDFTSSIALNDTISVAFENRSNCYLTLGNNLRAYDDATQAIRLNPRGWIGYNNRAGALINLEEWDKALPDIEAARELERNNPTVLANRSRILSKLGRFQEALRDAEQALKTEPKNALALANRGIALTGLNRIDEALEAFAKSIEIDPSLGYCYTARGEAYQRQGNKDQALVNFNRAIEVSPNYPEGYEKRGEFFRSQEDTSKAQADFDMARQLRG